MLRLESPDSRDWDDLTNRLRHVVSGGDITRAHYLRDRVLALADRYAPSAATVDLAMLRLDAQPLLAPHALQPDSAAEPDSALMGAARTRTAELAPPELRDRELELGELVQFCAGSDPYAWWQAGPWAGKTALLSWFALHPPGDIDVVAFFISSPSGQSHSDTLPRR